MTNKKHRDLTISKLLSYALRHSPSALGLNLDQQGWAYIVDVLVGLRRKGHELTYEGLQQLVAGNDKQRFAISDDRTKIRASQGHSIKVDLQLEPKQPTDILYHGTAKKNLESIREKGILKGNRNHVHLSGNPNTARRVGQRHGEAIVLIVDAPMMNVDDHEFYFSDNGVWLTDYVAPRYITGIEK